MRYDLFRYEHRGQRLIDRRHFLRRLIGHSVVASVLIVLSLLIGMAGYMWFEALPWPDAFLNASMLLGGMGPVDAPKTEAGKLFAGSYALYAGLVFLVSAGVLAAPLIHRILHKFHVEPKTPN